MSSEKTSNAAILVIIAIIVGVSVVAGSILQLSSVSYYEGVHPSFVAVYHDWQYYTTNDPGDASTARIGLSTLNFDPDHPTEGLPNLMGELRDVQVITDLSRYVPAETYAHILDMGGSPQPDEPYRSVIWQVEDREYQLDLWLCSLEVNTYVKADRGWVPFIHEQYNQRYRDTEIWLKLETTKEWGGYFEGAEEVNFGIAYMELADFEIFNEDPALDVLPKSQWAALDLWDDPIGMATTPDTPIAQAENLRGGEINPLYFKPAYYTRITLGSFGTYNYNILDTSYKADSIQHTILVHVLVVGEWKLKPDGERDLEIHEPPEKEGIWDYIKSLIDRFSTPGGKIQLALVLLVVVVVVSIILNPRLILDWIEVGKELTKK